MIYGKDWLPRILFALIVAMVGGLALSQEGDGEGVVSITTIAHEDFGSVLADADERPVYLLMSDSTDAASRDFMTEGVRPAAAECSGECLENWEPVAASAVEAVGDVDMAEGEGGFRSDLLYVEEVDGTSQAIYSGWPLYYFSGDEGQDQPSDEGQDQPSDEGQDQPKGHGLGSEGSTWYLVAPVGEPAGAPNVDDEPAADDASEEDGEPAADAASEEDDEAAADDASDEDEDPSDEDDSEDDEDAADDESGM